MKREDISDEQLQDVLLRHPGWTKQQATEYLVRDRLVDNVWGEPGILDQLRSSPLGRFPGDGSWGSGSSGSGGPTSF